MPPVPFAGRYLVLPGRYVVVAEKAGYRKLERAITVKFGSEPVLEYEMSKLPGLLDLVTRPIAEARVEIDGETIGHAPLKSYEIEAGQHELRVTAERYLPSHTTIEILGLGKRQSEEINLQPGWGTLVIASEPSDATVYLNGKLAGSTPLQTEPMGGTYDLELRKSGWKPVSSEVVIAAGKTLQLPLVQLEKVDAVIELSTSPTGANVTVNGQYRGQSPMTLTLPSDQDYKVTVSKIGFESASRSVSNAPRPRSSRARPAPVVTSRKESWPFSSSPSFR